MGADQSDLRARGYKRGTPLKAPSQLRVNAYRVLLTRGRACTVIYVPQMRELDETSAWLQEYGVKLLA